MPRRVGLGSSWRSRGEHDHALGGRGQDRRRTDWRDDARNECAVHHSRPAIAACWFSTQCRHANKRARAKQFAALCSRGVQRARRRADCRARHRAASPDLDAGATSMDLFQLQTGEVLDKLLLLLVLTGMALVVLSLYSRVD